MSLRRAGEMLAARGIVVSHETVRQWGLKFGQLFANAVRRRLPRPGDKWHLDEVVPTFAGRKHWLWRAAGQFGVVPGILVRGGRDTAAAKRLMRRLPKGQGWARRVMATVKLGSNGAARRATMPGVEHRRHKGLNDRAGISHQPTRLRERVIKRSRSPRQAQRFPSVHNQVANRFRRPAHLSNACHCRRRAQAFRTWADVTGVGRAA